MAPDRPSRHLGAAGGSDDAPGRNATSPDLRPRERPSVSLELLLLLAATAVLAAFALARVLRYQHGTDPRIRGRRLVALVIGFLIVLPAILDFWWNRGLNVSPAHAVASTILYWGFLAALGLLMAAVAFLVVRFAPVEVRPILVLALTGREPEAAGVPFDPPITEAISRGVALVDARNAVFPRGRAFTQQADQPGFAAAWADLDAATTALEALIAADTRSGAGVAEHAIETVADARSRLDALRRDARHRGQAWAA